MSPVSEPRRLSGPESLALTILFAFPAALSVFASYGLVHRWLYSTSALWFFYEISLYLGISGACFAGAFTIVQLIRRHIAAPFVLSMGLATAAAVALVWYAVHIYRDPWKW
jgi:hypothetical protein